MIMEYFAQMEYRLISIETHDITLDEEANIELGSSNAFALNTQLVFGSI